MAEDEMVVWHHGLNGYEFKQAPGVGEGQGSLACYSPWGHKEFGTTEGLINNNSSPNPDFLLSRSTIQSRLYYRTDKLCG